MKRRVCRPCERVCTRAPRGRSLPNPFLIFAYSQPLNVFALNHGECGRLRFLKFRLLRILKFRVLWRPPSWYTRVVRICPLEVFRTVSCRCLTCASAANGLFDEVAELTKVMETIIEIARQIVAVVFMAISLVLSERATERGVRPYVCDSADKQAYGVYLF